MTNVVIRTKQRSIFKHTVSNKFNKYVSALHPNQIQFGYDIRNLFLDRTVHTVLAAALTQSGKTGSMLAAIHSCMIHPSLAIPINNVFVITGHSSNEWVSQTKERFPTRLADNIIHRNSLKRFISRIKGMSNLLIFIDETQIASLKGQSIHNAFRDAGISEIDLYMRDIKMVLVSATPNSCIKRFIPPRVGYAISFMNPGIGYTSIFDLLRLNRVFQYKDICGYNLKTGKINPDALSNVLELKPLLGTIPKFHIIRTHHSFLQDITVNHFKTAFPLSSFILNPTDFDFLINPPSVHSFIFIKERLRCATTIHKDHLGILYERFSKRVSHSAIIQGLAGRITGYYSSSPVVFSNIHSILYYRSIWNDSFSSYHDSKSSWDF
uniref:Helicase ATP-binding domain-containing protein n=1 Tax=viral metagenome TaxID=1070528 RepID=A0A6C0JJU6_9ZZZZ